ncbi:hypothetical protein ANTRET_LOCUS9502 [Anthophora retusa]
MRKLRPHPNESPSRRTCASSVTRIRSPFRLIEIAGTNETTMPVQGVMLRIRAATLWAFYRHPGNHRDSPRARYLPVRVQRGIAVNRVKTLNGRKDPLYTSTLLQWAKYLVPTRDAERQAGRN